MSRIDPDRSSSDPRYEDAAFALDPEKENSELLYVQLSFLCLSVIAQLSLLISEMSILVLIKAHGHLSTVCSLLACQQVR